MMLPGYDAWLERPHQDAIAESERFLDWCEEHNIDPDDPDAEMLYQDYIDSSYEDQYDDIDEREFDDYEYFRRDDG
jgi:hypothetical protein